MLTLLFVPPAWEEVSARSVAASYVCPSSSWLASSLMDVRRRREPRWSAWYEYVCQGVAPECIGSKTCVRVLFVPRVSFQPFPSGMVIVTCPAEEASWTCRPSESVIIVRFPDEYVPEI